MVDPYDFIASPTGIKSKRTRRKSILKTSKKRKANEKRGHVSIREGNNQTHIRTRSNTRDTNHLIDKYDKENNPNNNGFTQLIQTKMMEVKKRQGNRKNRKANTINDDNHSSSVTRKRQRSDNEESPDVVLMATEIEIQRPDPPPNTTDEHVNVGTTTTTTTTTTCYPRCEAKDHHLVPANKRRRPCLCSKRQLDELEFAPDSVPSQTQHQQQQQQLEEEEQQPPQEESHLEPVLTLINHSPPPLLLPNSPLMPPSTLTFALPSISSISIIQHEETNIEEEKVKNQSNVPSIMAAPLSPAMPLNSTYIAHRSIPIVTQLPSAFLDLSTLISTNTTTTSNNVTSRLTSSIIPSSHIEPQKSDYSAILEPIESLMNRQDQQTSMTPTTDQIIQCSVSTQTSDDYYPTHHHCNDVSVCPCVQIYTRSEQLFMTSMAIFFRNSITITPPESSLTTINNPIRKNNKRQQINHQTSSQSTLIINETEKHIEANVNTENIGINETYVVNNNNNNNNNNEKTIPSIDLEPQPSSTILIDTSTVINETHHDNSKKSDDSCIQIDINSRQEFNEKSHEENLLLKSSNDQQKFKSLVLTMTALKDEQKIVFNRFIEHFSVRSSASIDDSTTHLITDEDIENSLICPLTGKVLQAVARHLTIVSYRWLTVCLSEQRYVDEIPTYEIIGDAIYNQHHGMSHSRINNSQNYRLLSNYAFHLKCHGCQPFIDNRPLIELIHLSGGLILKTLNQHIDNIGRQIIILCSKNYLQNKPALEQACRKLNILCIEPEWLIASIVKFDIQPFEPWLCTLFS